VTACFSRCTATTIVVVVVVAVIILGISDGNGLFHGFERRKEIAADTYVIVTF
jgi:hypothetical protein